jgi:hypothetical protein
MQYVKSYDSGPMICPLNNCNVAKRCKAISYPLKDIKRRVGELWEDFDKKYTQSQMFKDNYAMFDLRMCGRCKLGPVSNTGCNNLETNHGVPIKINGFRAWNNACHRCGWFVYTIDLWPKWDGVYHEV